MNKLKRFPFVLLCLALCLSSFAIISISFDQDVQALANPAADAAASVIRVKLSTGDLSTISLTISGTYSIETGPLAPGNYQIRNESNVISIVNSSGVTLLSRSLSLMITENQNLDTAALNTITMMVSGYARTYQGSMKFWMNGATIDVVNHVYLEKYLYGVVGYEMSNSFPLEALKAQAVAARCYAAKRLEGSRAAISDIGDTSSDQVYKGFNSTLANVKQAVDQTSGKALQYNGALITAYFAASNGGQTDRTENVWSAALPYFKIRVDPYDLANPSSLQNTVYFPVGTSEDKAEDLSTPPVQPPSPTIRYTQDDLNPKLVDFLKTQAVNQLTAANASLPVGSKYSTTADTIKIKSILNLSAIQTDAHPYCHHHADSTDGAAHDASNCPSIDFTGVKITMLLKVLREDITRPEGLSPVDYPWVLVFKIADYLKTDLYPQWQVFSPGNGLRIYAVERGADGNGLDSFKLINRRYGHGIGLSQRGAQQRAKDPNPEIYQYQNILAFYYPNTSLVDLQLVEPVLPPVPTVTPTPTPTVPPEETQVTILFDSQGGNVIPPIKALLNTRITAPADPKKTGYDFAGWHMDAAYLRAWDFNIDLVTGNMTLIAKWTPVSAEAKTAAFVTRFYQQCLGRNPDDAGLNSWVAQLMSGQMTGASVAYGFVFSQEFQNRHVSNSDYVTIMYNAFFDRSPDPDGYDNWIKALESGLSRYYVLAGFTNSQEFKNLSASFGIMPGYLVFKDPADLYPDITKFVTRFYQQCLNRMPDSVGLNNWVRDLQARKQTGAAVAYGFFFSQEFQNRQVSNSDYVKILYKAAFDRDPDPVGYNNWLKMLNNGSTRYSVLAGFVNSQEFRNLCQSYGVSSGSMK